jgi:hypothetical protein
MYGNPLEPCAQVHVLLAVGHDRLTKAICLPDLVMAAVSPRGAGYIADNIGVPVHF